MPNKHKICGIIDFAGSRYNGMFLVREVGYIGLGRSVKKAKGEVFDYKPYMLSFADAPSPKKARTSAPPPPPQMEVSDLRDLDRHILDFYEKVKTKVKNVVAFKGGECEKEVLERLGIPFKNLEDLGCPKYNEMDTKKFRSFACKYHKNKDLHCPVAEVAAFKTWLLEHSK